MLESEYVALGLTNLIASYRPDRVVLGGGVMHEEGLLEKVRFRTCDLLDTTYFPRRRRWTTSWSGRGSATPRESRGPSCSRRNLSEEISILSRWRSSRVA